MIKKLLSCVIAFGAILFVSCKTEASATDLSALPEPAQTTINNSFNGVKVTHVKVETSKVGVKEYEVFLENGTKIEFYADGSVEEIKAGKNVSVPLSVLPVSVVNYLNDNYKGQNVIKYDADNRGYEVELANGLEIEFDTQGNFVRIDR